MPGKLLDLTLQSTREGQAAHAHVHEIVAGLERRGWRIDLFEPGYRGAPPSVPLRVAEFTRLQGRLLRTLRRERCPVYLRYHPCAVPTAIAARALGVPFALEINGPAEDLYQAWPGARRAATLFESALGFMLREASAVVTVTPQLRDWALGRGARSPVEVIPNGANTGLFRPDAVCRLELPRPYVVFFGALAPWQGIEALLAATRHSAWPDEVTLAVAGDGALRPQVEAAAGSSGGRVRYVGRLAYRDVPGVVANSLGGIVPSLPRRETGINPLKVFETLACGVPAVVSDVPEQNALVREHACGLVFPPDDPAGLAEAVATLQADPAARGEMGGRGRALVEGKHSWDRRAEDTHVLLQRLLTGVTP